MVVLLPLSGSHMKIREMLMMVESLSDTGLLFVTMGLQQTKFML